MTISKEHFFIPEACRDHHLVMVPEFANIFKERVLEGWAFMMSWSPIG